MMRYVLILVILGLGGCFTTDTNNYAESQEQMQAINLEQLEKSRQLTSAVVDTLKDEGEEKASVHSKLALEFASQDQLLEGLPVNKIYVKDYIGLALSGKDSDLKKLKSKLAKLEKDVAEFRKFKIDQEVVLDARTQELVKKGMLYEEQNKKKFFERVWFWAKSTLGIGGIIAVTVLFPVVIPIFGQIIGAIVRTIPSLASAFGVVATSTVDSVVKGVQNTKKQFKESSPDKTYTKDEVLNILSGNLDFNTKISDKKLISSRKEKLQI